MEDEGQVMSKDSLSTADVTDAPGSSNHFRSKRSLRNSSVPPGDLRQGCASQEAGLMQ